MSRSIITLTTDFGSGSPYVAQIKGVILSIHPQAVLVDVTHDIAPQDVRQGALVLDDVTGRFPPGSIHVAVVDPGVGTDRRILAAEIGGRYYLAPDNGLLGRLAGRDPAARLVALTKREFWLPAVSATFHGRDILAPAAAHLSLGTALDDLGEAWDQPGGAVLAPGGGRETPPPGRDYRHRYVWQLDHQHFARPGRCVRCSGRSHRPLRRPHDQRASSPPMASVHPARWSR